MKLVWRIAATVLVTAFVLHWWPLLLFIAAVGFAGWFARYSDQRSQKLLQRQAEIADRADQQHRWVLQGDERGIYGVNLPDLRVSCIHR